MTIERVYISYPDFRMFDVIDSEQFDVNNREFQEKINELVDLLNVAYTPKEGATSGAEMLSMKPIAPFEFEEGANIQDFLEQLIERLQNIQRGTSGAELIGSPSITGIEGTTVYDQLLSVDAILRNLNMIVEQLKTSSTTLNNQLATHKHNDVYYTKAEMDAVLSQRDTTVHGDVFTIVSIGTDNTTFTYRDNKGSSHTSTIDAQGSMLFTLSKTYEPNANMLTVIVDDVLHLSAISGGLIEVSESQFKTTTALKVGQELTCRYSKRTRIGSEYSLSYGTTQPASSSNADIWFKVVE